MTRSGDLQGRGHWLIPPVRSVCASFATVPYESGSQHSYVGVGGGGLCVQDHGLGSM
jgi:hypothetical protein